MNISLLADPLLLLIMAFAAFFSMATSLQVATRPAAVKTGLVATALTMGQLIFIVTRFGNLFYLPLLGNFVDKATASSEAGQTLIDQISWIIVGSAGGALIALALLPSFVTLCIRGVHSIDARGSLLRALLNLKSPKAWKTGFKAIRPPGMMGTTLFQTEGLPKAFLFFNVVATAIWTVGALSAIAVSGLHPEFKQTALLLSGLVNSFAAIAFSVWVDPQAAMITDRARANKELEEKASPESEKTDKNSNTIKITERHVTIASIHLVLGNFLGALLGLVLLKPAISLIAWATLAIGESASELDAAMIWLIVGNALILLLNGTIYSSRVSAVRTARVATSIAVFNFFSLIARVAGQVYGPFVGAVTDQLTEGVDSASPAQFLEAASRLENFNRGLILGATIGCILSVLLIPTFVKIYDKIIIKMIEKGELSTVLMMSLHPKRWGTVLSTLTAPWKQHVSRAALARLPKGFLWANVLVLGFQTVGQLAAIYAGAVISPEVARTATLLSPLINGIATITLSILVDPGCATLVDEAIKGKRDTADIETMTFWLAVGTVGGTLASQLLFIPAARLIGFGAEILGALL